MNTMMWIILGLTVWSVASLPLALVVGRLLRGSSADTSRPAPAGSGNHVLAA